MDIGGRAQGGNAPRAAQDAPPAAPAGYRRSGAPMAV